MMTTDCLVGHFVYALSSSVCGANKKVSYLTDDKVGNSVLLYTAMEKG